MEELKNNIERFSAKQVIATALLFMMIGTAMELYLLDHYEGPLQLIPLLCIGTSLLVMLLLFFQSSTFMLGLFKVLMGITALSGVYGIFLHLRANYEFEKEMKATASDWELFIESLSGALPTLAPASMIVLALIGYSYLILLRQKQ